MLIKTIMRKKEKNIPLIAGGVDGSCIPLLLFDGVVVLSLNI
jgi:hypothetical protein